MTLGQNLSNFATNIEAKSSLERQYFWSAYVLVSFYQSYFKEVSSLCYGSFYRWSWMMVYPKCRGWALCVCSWDRMFLVLSLRDQSMFPAVVTRFPQSWRGQFTVILRVWAPCRSRAVFTPCHWAGCHTHFLSDSLNQSQARDQDQDQSESSHLETRDKNKSSELKNPAFAWSEVILQDQYLHFSRKRIVQMT